MTLDVIKSDDISIEVIALDRLFVDERYQRPLDEKRIQTYLNAYDQKLVEPLTVNRRQDGRFSVCDGQHRLALLRLLSKTEWPCVVHTLSGQQEAKLFVDLQEKRKQIIPAHRHRARLFQGDQRAIDIDQITRDAGYEVGSKGIGAVTALYKVHDQYGKDILSKTLRVIHDAWDGDSNATRTGMIMGMAYFLAAFDGEVGLAAFATKLQTTAPHKVIGKARGFTAFDLADDSRSAVALALVDEYNAKRRNGKLSPERITSFHRQRSSDASKEVQQRLADKRAAKVAVNGD